MSEFKTDDGLFISKTLYYKMFRYTPQWTPPGMIVLYPPPGVLASVVSNPFNTLYHPEDRGKAIMAPAPTSLFMFDTLENCRNFGVDSPILGVWHCIWSVRAVGNIVAPISILDDVSLYEKWSIGGFWAQKIYTQTAGAHILHRSPLLQLHDWAPPPLASFISVNTVPPPEGTLIAPGVVLVEPVEDYQ